MSRPDDHPGGFPGQGTGTPGDGHGEEAVRLALIGDNIAASRSPQLHRLAGALCGVRVEYELLMPPRLGRDFEAVFDHCAGRGLRGVNITYPYKERVAAKIRFADERLRSIGGVNTVVFDDGEAIGYNTDYSGFIAAWRRGMDGIEPGIVCLLGAGGVGKATAFALLELGLRELRIVERDAARAEALADALATAARHLRVDILRDATQAAHGADGLVNCTPIGMVGITGSVLARDAMGDASWAFDAVYTPVNTEFLGYAAAHGLRILSGYELFFYQGLDAFERFTGRRPDERALRAALEAGVTPPVVQSAGNRPKPADAG